jgi:hypothetical protein
MSGAAHDLKIEQGDDWSPIWTLRYRGSQQPFDLTGYTAKMQIRSTYYAAAKLVDLVSPAGIILGGVAGTIQPVISDAQTMTLIPTGAPAPNPVNVKINDRAYTLVGVYDLKITSAGGATMTVAGGRVLVSPDVTR